MKRALITGITGQDGSYLAELLLEKQYKVFGIRRQFGGASAGHVQRVEREIEWILGDLTDLASVTQAIQQAKPDEVYNLAAQSFVASSWDHPSLTGKVTAIGVSYLLEALHRTKPDARFFQASSADMFGKSSESPQRETTPFLPANPYAVSKLYGHWTTVNYRESLGMYTCSGILFNHESPRRGAQFVTRKVTQAVASIKMGLQSRLGIGNLDARRDWGFAGDYVNAMWRMLQQQMPDDYVIATGKTHSVRELLDIAFRHAGLSYEDYVYVEPSLIRLADVVELRGDASKAREQLGWEPKVSFADLVVTMVEADMALLRKRPFERMVR